MQLQKKVTAYVKEPLIEAVVKELYRLPTDVLAQKKIDQIKNRFVVSKEQPDEACVRLWIKGYALTDSEKTAGYTGNFAQMGYKQTKGKFVLFATKLVVELKAHPGRKYQVQSKHPNWGHPILRSIQHGAKHESIDAAMEQLMRLHEQYPEATIPGEGKLSVIIFSRATSGEKPVKKYTLEIKPDGDQVIIICRENQPRGKKLPAEPKEVMGRHTARVTTKRKPKKKK